MTSPSGDRRRWMYLRGTGRRRAGVGGGKRLGVNRPKKRWAVMASRVTRVSGSNTSTPWADPPLVKWSPYRITRMRMWWGYKRASAQGSKRVFSR